MGYNDKFKVNDMRIAGLMLFWKLKPLSMHNDNKYSDDPENKVIVFKNNYEVREAYRRAFEIIMKDEEI